MIFLRLLYLSGALKCVAINDVQAETPELCLGRRCRVWLSIQDLMKREQEMEERIAVNFQLCVSFFYKIILKYQMDYSVGE